jgi:hypothetical protein
MDIASSLLEKMKDTLEKPNVVSLGKFIARNRDSLNVLLRSGKSIKEIYEYLNAEGQDVGTYHSFRTVCYRTGLRRRDPAASAVQKNNLKNTKTQASVGSKTVDNPPKPDNACGKEEHKANVSKYNPALPPVILPGGVEAIIDPETGAKRFEI